MWRQASLKFKLMSSFLAVSLFILAVGGTSYWTLHAVSAGYGKVVDLSLPNVMALGDMRASAYATVRNITLISNSDASEEQRKKFGALLDQRLEEYAKADKAYTDVPFEEGEEALYNEANQNWQKLKAVVDQMRPLTGTKDAAVQDKLDKMVLEDLTAATSAYLASLDKVRDFQMVRAKNYVAAAGKSREAGNVFTVIAIAAGIILAMVIGWAFANSLSKKFSGLAQQLLLGAEEVASASQQISSASEQLSAAAAEQAASLQETSASVEEITAMVNKNTDNANQSRSTSETTRESADSGRKAVDDMINAVRAISTSNEEIGTRIHESNQEFAQIVKVINEIGNKTKVINDIVFQTKLLSFNASVEAARAGEHGKGFAVVAEEVGNLAQMSGNAAKEISSMLEGSIQQVEGIVNRTQGDLDRLMASGKDKVHTGQSVAERCGKILEEVVNQVSQMNRMSTEIASASNEQSQGVQEISNAMRQLDQVTQQNASAAHQAASASTELSSQAEKLHGLVGDLTAFVQGTGSARSFKADVNSHRAHREKNGSGHSSGHGFGHGSGNSNVIPMKKHDAPEKRESRETPAFKAAAGSDTHPPLDTDPRFRDI